MLLIEPFSLIKKPVDKHVVEAACIKGGTGIKRQHIVKTETQKATSFIM